ncbi:class I SAM-dependent methyltransferase [Cellulomonas sp. Leaf395]|uniref:class I SAM-dependent methyltransferase n=1 Tax=Cellulomonas sp. Leaf395 TaxID=1736362 RepID=UPI0006FFCB1B|nr:class I SAM-dependent methyltransferase [Cellulomonas sp. Leaf395]KQS99767.1 hypothetical protein ASG23_10570 [Cellulomonas sp. Leaf395]
MLDRTTIARILYSVSRDDPAHALQILGETDAVPESQRARLTDVLESGDTAVETARRLGDALADEGVEKDIVNECYRAAFYLGDRWADLAENPLYAYFLANRAGGVLHKWPHYFPIYHRHLERYRGRPVRVLEIGVYRGGGLTMWQRYFGKDAVIIGADIDEAAVRATEGRFVVELGDQADPSFLRGLHEKYGPFDVVIDDGGHTMEQQIVTAETLFPLLADDGLLIVEDTHTSYWPAFGGGLHEPTSFLAWARARVDDLNSQHHQDLDRSSVWSRQLGGVHFYDSVVVFDREPRFRAFDEVAGGSSYILADQVSERIAVESAAERERVREELASVREQSARLTAQLARVDADGSAEALVAERHELEESLRRARGERADMQSRLTSADRRDQEHAAALDALHARLAASEERLRLLEGSVSWKVTGPLRAVRRTVRHG